MNTHSTHPALFLHHFPVRRTVLASLAVGLGAFLPAAADEFSYTNLGGNPLWSNPANWNKISGAGPQTIPGAGDTIVNPSTTAALGMDGPTFSVMDWNYSGSSNWAAVAYVGGGGGSGVTVLNITDTLTHTGSGEMTFRNSGNNRISLNANDVVVDADGTLSFGTAGNTTTEYAHEVTLGSLNLIDGDVGFNVGLNNGIATVTGDVTMGAGTRLWVALSNTGSPNRTLEVGSLNSSSSTAAVAANWYMNTTTHGTLDLNTSGSADFAGELVNTTGTNTTSSLSVEMNGAGTQELSGTNNTYEGTTTVNNGTLLISGQHNGGGAYTVNDGGTLAGTNGESQTNIITANDAGITIASGGMLSMGTSPGIFSANLGGGVMDISGAVGGGNSGSLIFDLAALGASDQFRLLGGTLEIGMGELEFADFDFAALAGIQEGDYVLFDTGENISGSLGADLTGIFGSTWQGTLFIQDGQDIALSVVQVPEPATGTLLLAGMGLTLLRRRRKEAAVS